jgi:hypothetical protein
LVDFISYLHVIRFVDSVVDVVSNIYYEYI